MIVTAEQEAIVAHPVGPAEALWFAGEKVDSIVKMKMKMYESLTANS